MTTMYLVKDANQNVHHQIVDNMSTCKDEVNKPAVDNSAIECCGIYPTNCVVTSERDTFLPYGKGETLTNVLKVISNRIKTVYQQQMQQNNNNNPALNFIANGFKVTSCLNENITLPENTTLEYVGPLSMCVGKTLTVPTTTTLTII